MPTKAERRRELLKELAELEDEAGEAPVEEAKAEAKSGGSRTDVEEAAKEAGATTAQAKAIAQAVVAELKEGGYLAEDEENETEGKEDGDKAEEGAEEKEEKKVDEEPTPTHKWYR